MNHTSEYIVINDGCFYKKGSVLIYHNSTGCYAPAGHPACHFLKENFILSLPKVFKKK